MRYLNIRSVQTNNHRAWGIRICQNRNIYYILSNLFKFLYGYLCVFTLLLCAHAVHYKTNIYIYLRFTENSVDVFPRSGQSGLLKVDIRFTSRNVYVMNFQLCSRQTRGDASNSTEGSTPENLHKFFFLTSLL